MRLVWVVIPLVLIGIIGIQESFAEEPHTMTSIKGDMKITLQTNKAEYSQKEIIHITSRVENMGTESIVYQLIDSCDDGYRTFVSGNGVSHRSILYPENVLLIDEDDPLLEKFSYGFYGKILEVIESGENREFSVLFLANEHDKLEEVLRKNHDVTSISRGNVLSFFGATVQAEELVKIATQYNFVRGIGENLRACAQGMSQTELLPGQSIVHEISWSQRSSNNSTVFVATPGNYTVISYLVADSPTRIYAGVRTCLPFKIVGEKDFPSLSECDLKPLISRPVILPNWVMDKARWWATDQSSDDQFANAIRMVMDEQLVDLLNSSEKDQHPQPQIPDWFKNVAKWWSTGYISEEDFIKCVKNLVEEGIIQVP